MDFAFIYSILELLSAGLNLASAQLKLGVLKPSNTVKNGEAFYFFFLNTYK